MKVIRIVQLLCIAILVGFTIWLHLLNQENYPNVPLFIDIPVAFLLCFAFSCGWILAYTPSKIMRFRQQREITRLAKRVADLERTLGIPSSQTRTVIPDRDPTISRQSRSTQ